MKNTPVKIIAAMTKNKVIGFNGRIPWKVLSEMKHFVGEWVLTTQKAPWATMARGTQRKHKVGACQSHHALSIDLTGPFPPCLGKSFCYGLVAVYSVGVGENLPFIQGTRGKSGEECTHAVLRIIKEIMWLSEGALIVRIHSDEGGEFWNNIMESHRPTWDLQNQNRRL